MEQHHPQGEKGGTQHNPEEEEDSTAKRTKRRQQRRMKERGAKTITLMPGCGLSWRLVLVSLGLVMRYSSGLSFEHDVHCGLVFALV